MGYLDMPIDRPSTFSQDVRMVIECARDTMPKRDSRVLQIEKLLLEAHSKVFSDKTNFDRLIGEVLTLLEAGDVIILTVACNLQCLVIHNSKIEAGDEDYECSRMQIAQFGDWRYDGKERYYLEAPRVPVENALRRLLTFYDDELTQFHVGHSTHCRIEYVPLRCKNMWGCP